MAPLLPATPPGNTPHATTTAIASGSTFSGPATAALPAILQEIGVLQILSLSFPMMHNHGKLSNYKLMSSQQTALLLQDSRSKTIIYR